MDFPIKVNFTSNLNKYHNTKLTLFVRYLIYILNKILNIMN